MLSKNMCFACFDCEKTKWGGADMSIFEYDKEAEIAKIKKMEREDEREFWQKEIEKIKKEAIERRRVFHLIPKVYKKIQKNKSLEQIADELEEEIKVLRPIYEILKAAGDNLDCDLIYEELQKREE